MLLTVGKGDVEVGDVNGDGTVNCADLYLVKASLGKHRGDAGYNPKADINGDGVVDLKDLELADRHVRPGTVCP